MLPFEQLRKDLVQDVSYRDKAVYSPKIDPADDFDKDHPVYISDGVQCSQETESSWKLHMIVT